VTQDPGAQATLVLALVTVAAIVVPLCSAFLTGRRARRAVLSEVDSILSIVQSKVKTVTQGPGRAITGFGVETIVA